MRIAAKTKPDQSGAVARITLTRLGFQFDLPYRAFGIARSNAADIRGAFKNDFIRAIAIAIGSPNPAAEIGLNIALEDWNTVRIKDHEFLGRREWQAD